MTLYSMVLPGTYTDYTRANTLYSNLCLCSHINSVRTMDVSVYYGETLGTQERHAGLPCNEQRNHWSVRLTIWQLSKLADAIHPVLTGFGKVVISIEGFQRFPCLLTPFRNISDT